MNLPYHNYQSYQDPNQYIILNNAPGHQRGRFELAFSQIGGSILTGGLFGGTLGTVRGLKVIKTMPDPLKKTQAFNSIIKGGTKSANAFGVVALLYSSMAVGLSFVREDDDINTIAAATLTGLITATMTGQQRSLTRSGVGAALGLAISLVYCKVPDLFKKT